MKMRMSEFLNDKIHGLMMRRVMRAYHDKLRSVERYKGDLFRPVSAELSKKHKNLWSRLGVKSGDRWLRFYVNLTGIEDYTFCPQDIFFARIERVLNDCNQSGFGPDEKNELIHYLPKGAEPETVLRFVRGCFYDSTGKWMSLTQAREILNGEFVGKPCRASGGSGVVLRSDFTPEWIIKHGGESYVVQKKINQSFFSAQFNPSSINTVRMMTMRCPWNGEIVVCRSMMRIGVGDTLVDNMMKGGVSVCIDDKGRFSRYAYDYNAKQYVAHPVNGLVFEGMSHPGYGKMVSLVKEIHSNITAFNLLSFDLVQRMDESICVVEINATSQGVFGLQFDFGGLFGEYTENVVDWCSSNLKYDRFSHIRTWY